MRLATFFAPDVPEPLAGEVRADEVIAFGDGTTVRDRIATADSSPAAGQRWPLDAVTLLAPIQRPGAIYGIGLNYASHAAEQGAEPPQRPIVFMKAPSSVTAPGGPVVRPAATERLDYEGELAIVVGRDGRIGGFAVANDVTARDLQSSEPQWSRAKGAATFCPYGPWITTPDEVPDPGRLSLRTRVNGDLRQDASTNDLIFGVDALLAFLAETQLLEPGDLILTGTPAGVGFALDPPRFLAPGDVVRVEIEHLGAIEQRIEDPV